MHELLVERPRWAHAARYPRAFVRNRSRSRSHSHHPSGVRNVRDVRALDDAPSRESLSRSRYGDKQLSENFAPLLRFLRRNVGRPWKAVHSEMASVLAPSNAVQRHVLVHVADFLFTNVYESEGALWAASRGWGPVPLGASTRHPLFYVHPRSQLLCMIERAPRKPPVAKRPPNPNVHELSPTKQLRRLGGLWYELTVAPFPAWPSRRLCVDAITKRRVRWETYDLYPELKDLWASGRYTVSRRQIAQRELREHLASACSLRR